MDFGTQLKKFRLIRNLKQSELSEIAGISSIYVSEMERNKKIPTIDVLSKLCKALGIGLSDFFKIEDDSDNYNNMPRMDEFTSIMDFVINKSNMKYIRLAILIKENNIDPIIIENLINSIKKGDKA